jgi:hypothetical protein
VPASGAAPGFSLPGSISAGGSPGSPATPPTIPDYGSLIQGDPALQQSESLLGAQGVANQAQRDAVFQTGFEQYGATPDLVAAAKSLGLSASDLQGIITPTIQKLAADNTAAGTSTTARLAANDAKATQGIENALAARGIFRSGETGYQLGQEHQAYTNSEFDALQKLFANLSQAQGGYLSAEQQRLEAIAQALSDAANRALQEYPPTPGSPAVPPTPGVTASLIGVAPSGPIYQDAQGNQYNSDGSPASAAQTSYNTPTYSEPGVRNVLFT